MSALDGNKIFPVYVPNESVYSEKESELLDNLQQWYTSDGSDWNDLSYSKERLSYIIDMVEKMRLYFHTFHNGMEMGELNEACLYCFWFLKLYPFFDTKDPDNDWNRYFALELFTNAITYTANSRNPKEKANFDPHIIKHLLHAFRFRDLSKEVDGSWRKPDMQKTVNPLEFEGVGIPTGQPGCVRGRLAPAVRLYREARDIMSGKTKTKTYKNIAEMNANIDGDTKTSSCQ
jgi:hypothetical protein